MATIGDEYKKLIRKAVEQGWREDRTSKGHPILYSPDKSVPPVVTSGTPSDYRAFRNFRANLKRKGVKLDGLRGLGRLSMPKQVTPAVVKRVMKRMSRTVKSCGIKSADLARGMKVELEHTNVTHGDVLKTAKIAAAHLCESGGKYYSELARMERRLRRPSSKRGASRRRRAT